MGTTWSVRLVAVRNADLHPLHAGIQARLDAVVGQMSTWEADSDISRYNRAEAGEWLTIPDQFHTVLACALDIAEASDGAFDPAIGGLVGLWGFGADARAGHTIPDATQVRFARERGGWRRVQLDRQARRVQQPGGLRLDLSAIAKGYGVDLVVAQLREAGIAGGLVEVGGELYGYGSKPDGEPWRVLVEAGPDADDATEPRVVELHGMAVATSGDRWHHYDLADAAGVHRYTHTIDPRNGAPVARAPTAVSVVATSAMHADAWATALTVLGANAGFAFAQERGLAARFLDHDEGGVRERMTDAFRARLAA